MIRKETRKATGLGPCDLCNGLPNNISLGVGTRGYHRENEMRALVWIKAFQDLECPGCGRRPAVVVMPNYEIGGPPPDEPAR